MGFPLVLAYPLGGDTGAYALSAADPRGGSDGTLRPIADHCAQGLDLLISQYKEKPRIEAWLCSFLDRAQNLENAILAIYENALSLDTGRGAALDLIGKIVREDRNGRDDDDYRRSLRVRVLVNRSQGTTPELIEIARLFEEVAAESGAFVRIQDVQPARVEARIVRTPVNAAAEVDKRLRLAKAAGVALQTLIHPGGPAGSFRFCSAADYPEKSATEGFSDSAGSVTGGAWAHVLD